MIPSLKHADSCNAKHNKMVKAIRVNWVTDGWRVDSASGQQWLPRGTRAPRFVSGAFLSRREAFQIRSCPESNFLLSDAVAVYKWSGRVG